MLMNQQQVVANQQEMRATQEMMAAIALSNEELRVSNTTAALR